MALADNSFNLVEFERNRNSVSVGVNGTMANPVSISGYNPSSYNATAIGAEDSGGASFFQGDMAEIIIFPSVPDLATRQKIEGYLMNRYGLTGLLPVNPI